MRDMPSAQQGSAFSGKTVVFTGTLKNFTRDGAKEAVEVRGGRAASSVSGNTDFVVAGEKPGSKLDQAKEQNVTILSEKEFRRMI